MTEDNLLADNYMQNCKLSRLNSDYRVNGMIRSIGLFSCDDSALNKKIGQLLRIFAYSSSCHKAPFGLLGHTRVGSQCLPSFDLIAWGSMK